MTQFHDEVVQRGGAGLPDGFFDRFMFNLHPTDAVEPALILGFGVYPGPDVADGYVGVVTDGIQRNVRFSTTWSAESDGGAGPLKYEVVEPMRTWHLVVTDNPEDITLDATWTARAQAWSSTVAMENSRNGQTQFEHLVQSGRWSGELRIDGTVHDLEGWYGQRDRSRGVRTMAGGQGLHLWFQAQFPDRTVSFLLVEDREGGLILLEGSVLTEAGELDEIVAVGHDLEFDDGLDLRGGRVVVRTASGAAYPLDVDAGGRGFHMAGLGYGGWHGKPRGTDHLEHDRYVLDGSVTPRSLAAPLTDRVCRFRCGDLAGVGIFEFAHSRSGSYTYRPRALDAVGRVGG